jgi:polyisoprenoid-binding protein YceI
MLFSFSSLSMAGTWVTNRDHSEIMFQIPYMGVSEVSGRFNEFKGKVELQGKGFQPVSLYVEIRTDSIDTGNKMRDGHLEGSDFLQGDQHPYISFSSHQISKMSSNHYKASGSLKIKGVSRAASVEFSVSDFVKDTWGYENLFVKFKSYINRKDYQITWNKTLDGNEFLVGDQITFWGTFQLQPIERQTPNSKHMIPDTQHIRQRDMNRRLEGESSISKKLRNLINGK